MIIAISGTPGSGKSTVAKAIAKEFNLKHYSTGDFMREMAAKRNLSLMELERLAEKDFSIDRQIDEYSKNLVNEDNFIIDSRLAFHFIPKAIKIFLKVDPKIAAKRVWKDLVEKKRTVEKGFHSEADVLKGIVDRQDSEVKRYIKYYKINYLDEKNYDFVLDTNMPIDQVIEKVLKFLKSK